MPLPDDRRIYPVLSELVACLCNELGDDASPCFCGLIVGPQAVPVELDDCESCGAGYVRLDGAFPSNNFPDSDDLATCMTVMAYTVAVGIQRCAPVGDDRGNPPTQEEQQEFARLMMADMAAARRAIQCCLTDAKFTDIEYVMGSWVPTPNQGGVQGGEWTLTIREMF